MPTPLWNLALVELLYYVPTVVPVSYCMWNHRRTGFTGWLFILAFVLLHIISSALTLGADKNGTPSRAAAIINNTGPSSLLLGIAGLVYEWTMVVGFLKERWLRKFAQIILTLYHLAMFGATVTYIVGASMTFRSISTAETMRRTGILLLLLFWVHLSAIFGLLAGKLGIRTSTPHFWSLPTCLIFLGGQIIYEVVATFARSLTVRASLANIVIFEFLPGALVVLDAVIGGVMTVELKDQNVDERVTEEKHAFEEISVNSVSTSKRQACTVVARPAPLGHC